MVLKVAAQISARKGNHKMEYSSLWFCLRALICIATQTEPVNRQINIGNGICINKMSHIVCIVLQISVIFDTKKKPDDHESRRSSIANVDVTAGATNRSHPSEHLHRWHVIEDALAFFSP
jgi:hypothetical protein